MKRASLVFAAALLAMTLLAATISIVGAQNRLPLRQATAASAPDSQSAAVSNGPGIQHTERISIPYGITDTLPLRNGGQEVLVIGHGSCTAGETVTIMLTVTHSATALTATGQLTEPCAGEETLQIWSTVATATTSPLPAGQAEVCGLATTYEGETQTDSYAWCRPDVTLAWLYYLPLLAGGELDNG